MPSPSDKAAAQMIPNPDAATLLSRSSVKRAFEPVQSHEAYEDVPTHFVTASAPPTPIGGPLDAPTQIWSPAKDADPGAAPVGMAWLMLPDLRLTIDEGDIIMITGSSGPGKSDLLEKIASRARQQWGWMGQAGKRLGQGEGDANRPLGRCCATVHRQSFFDPRKSVIENVRLPMQIAGLSGARWNQRLRDAMECLELPIDDKNMGPMHELHPELRQRIGWARALACDPQLLLIDQAMFCLTDEIKARLLKDIKARTARGGTVIWATTGIPVGLKADNFRWIHLEAGLISRDERLVKGDLGSKTSKTALSNVEQSPATKGA